MCKLRRDTWISVESFGSLLSTQVQGHGLLCELMIGKGASTMELVSRLISGPRNCIDDNFGTFLSRSRDTVVGFLISRQEQK